MGAARTIISLVLIIVLAATAVGVFIAMQGDGSRMIGFALGNETDDTVEIHLELTQMMSTTDVDSHVNVNGNTIWADWANAHYLITDPQGQQITLSPDQRSNLVNDAQHRGLTVMFLKGTLRKGTPYTITYIPVLGGQEKFQYQFTPTPQNLGRQRVSFLPVR